MFRIRLIYDYRSRSCFGKLKLASSTAGSNNKNHYKHRIPQRVRKNTFKNHRWQSNTLLSLNITKLPDLFCKFNQMGMVF
jgi:hypothetical protein